MSGMIGETSMLQAINNGFQSIQQNPSQLSEILDALSPAELQSAMNYFGNPKTKIGIAPGFPMETTQLPFIGVTVANSEQDMSRTAIGMNYGQVINADESVSPLIGARFNGQFKATIYTPNANLIVWLTEIVFWAIFTQLQLFVDAGMNRVQVNVGDYEPAPNFFPVFTFSRGVFLMGQYTKTYPMPALPETTSASITLNETEGS